MKKRQARKVMDKVERQLLPYRLPTYENACKRMGFTQKHRLWTNGVPSIQWTFTKPGYDAFGYPVGYLDKMRASSTGETEKEAADELTALAQEMGMYE